MGGGIILFLYLVSGVRFIPSKLFINGNKFGEKKGKDGIDFSLWEASLDLKVLQRRWN